MNVLFVSDSQISRTPCPNESTRYRCFHMAEGLHAAGVFADVTTLASLNMANLSRYDVVSIQQPSASRKLLNVLERCQQLRIKTVADIDALEFDPTLAKYSRKSRQKNSTVASVRLAFMRQSLALQHFDEVSVATEALARHRRALAPQQRVYVVPNGLSMYWLSSHDQLESRTSSRRRMGYFPTSDSHSIDFAQAAKSVSTYLHGSPDRELFTVGPLIFPADQLPASQLVRSDWIDFSDMPKALSDCWANLAPHQHNYIDYAQPHTKFIEAAAFGVPTISSPSDEILRHDVTGLLVAKTSDKWLDCLNELADEVFYKKCAQALYDYARDCCMASQSAELLLRHWNATYEPSCNESVSNLSAAS